MPNIEIIIFVANVIFGGLVWFLKRELTFSSERLLRLENEVNTMKSTYLHKDDFREFKQELKDMFEEIKRDIHSLRDRNG